MPLTPGYGKIMIKPQVGTLTSGSYSLPTIKGTITVAFESRRGQSIKITIKIPSSSTAKVYVPAFGLVNNDVLVDNKKITGVRDGDFISVDSISSGSHVIERNILVESLRQKTKRFTASNVMIIPGTHSARFSINDKLHRPASMTVYDCRGKKVCSLSLQGADERTIDLTPGTYVSFIKFPGSKPFLTKFLIQ
jgi:hypothetical protein